MSDVENHKEDALRVLRDFQQTDINSLGHDDRQTLLEAILGVPASSRAKLRNGTPPSRKKARRPDNSANDSDYKPTGAVVTPKDVRRKLLGGGGDDGDDDGEDEPERECPGAPTANRRRMRIPRHVRALFQGDADDD